MEGWGCRATTAWPTASCWSSTQGCRCHAFVSRETPSNSGFGSQTAAPVPTYSYTQNEGNNIIDDFLQPRSQLPLISHDIANDQIPSIHAKLGLHVSETNRTIIKNGEFIEHVNLLENKSAQRDEKTLSHRWHYRHKRKTKNSINTIEKWIDAFVIYEYISVSFPWQMSRVA